MVRAITLLAGTYCNTLINPALAAYYNYNKKDYFTLFCLELKDISNIKEIEKGEMSNELGKEKP